VFLHLELDQLRLITSLRIWKYSHLQGHRKTVINTKKKKIILPLTLQVSRLPESTKMVENSSGARRIEEKPHQRQ